MTDWCRFLVVRPSAAPGLRTNQAAAAAARDRVFTWPGLATAGAPGENETGPPEASLSCDCRRPPLGSTEQTTSSQSVSRVFHSPTRASGIRMQAVLKQISLSSVLFPGQPVPGRGWRSDTHEIRPRGRPEMNPHHGELETEQLPIPHRRELEMPRAAALVFGRKDERSAWRVLLCSTHAASLDLRSDQLSSLVVIQKPVLSVVAYHHYSARKHEVS